MENKKMGLLKFEKMGEYEKEKGFASYRTIIERFAGDIVLCNNIIDVDNSVYDNMKNGCYYWDNIKDDYTTEEEYNNDKENNISMEYKEIYQYYLCNLTEYEEQQLLNAGCILSYSDLLECDVLCVDHFGTSWDYVLTDVKLFDTYEELEKYQEEED